MSRSRSFLACRTAARVGGAVALAIAFAGCRPSQAARTPPVLQIPRFPVEEFTLANGLRVIVSVDRSAPVVALDVYYHVGSSSEVPGRTGYAHLIEHLMFEGSQHVPGARHRQILTEGGGFGHAFTLVDHTYYFNTFPGNLLETVLWLESDRMGFLIPELTQEKFKLQRDVVNNERRQNYGSRPYGVEPLLAMPAVYPRGHPHSWRVIGYEDDLGRATVDDLKAFIAQHYVPNNAVLTIVGDVDVQQTRLLVEKYFAGIPRGPEHKAPPAVPVTLASDKRIAHEDARARLPQMTLIWPTVGVKHSDEVALVALGSLLGAERSGRSLNRSARLTKTLVQDLQLATNVQVYQGSDEQVGEFWMHVYPREGVTLTQLEVVIDSVLAAIPASPATEKEIQRLRNYLTVDRITALQSVEKKADALSLSKLFSGNPHQYATDAEEIGSVTSDDIDRVVKRYILGKGKVVISAVPAGKLDAVSRPDVPYTNVTPGPVVQAPK